MTDKYRYKEGTKGGIYFVEERSKSQWNIIKVFYSVAKCREFIKRMENKGGSNGNKTKN